MKCPPVQDNHGNQKDEGYYKGIKCLLSHPLRVTWLMNTKIRIYPDEKTKGAISALTFYNGVLVSDLEPECQKYISSRVFYSGSGILCLLQTIGKMFVFVHGMHIGQVYEKALVTITKSTT